MNYGIQTYICHICGSTGDPCKHFENAGTIYTPPVPELPLWPVTEDGELRLIRIQEKVDELIKLLLQSKEKK